MKETIKNQDSNKKNFQLLKAPNLNEPMESLLRSSDVKTFILWGAEDRVLDSSGAKILETVMVNSKAIVLENTGHAPMIENPEKTAELYLNFHKIK